MARRYITAEEFSDFSDNQNTLISILNHNMTKLGVDVGWLKKLVSWQVGIITAIGAGIIIAIVKSGGL